MLGKLIKIAKENAKMISASGKTDGIVHACQFRKQTQIHIFASDLPISSHYRAKKQSPLPLVIPPHKT